MSSDSSRPGTSTSNQGGSSGSNHIVSGIKGIRASKSIASESWDDDFLWQHSSSSDLHLPSTATRHRHHRHSHSQSSSIPHIRDKRVSTSSSSSEFYQPRPVYGRTYRKASALSTSTTSSIADDVIREVLGSSTSSSSNGYVQLNGDGTHWASLSKTSLQEEEDESTITLATLAARQQQQHQHIQHRLSPPTTPHRATQLPLRKQQQQASPVHLEAPSPSFFRTISSSSWRSTTPSLAPDNDQGILTSGSASATETDNETAEEGDEAEDNTETWEELQLSPGSSSVTSSIISNANNAAEGGSVSKNHRREKGRRGRGNTLERNHVAVAPRLALSALFGSSIINSASTTTIVPEATADSSMTTTPSKGLGASFFRRSSKRKKTQDSPLASASIKVGVPPASAEITNWRHQPQPQEGTPRLTDSRELPAPTANEAAHTIRARQSTGASSGTISSTSPYSHTEHEEEQVDLSSPRRRLSPILQAQASFERTPKTSDQSHRGWSPYSLQPADVTRLSYTSTLSEGGPDAVVGASLIAAHPGGGLADNRNSLRPPTVRAERSSASLASNNSTSTYMSGFSTASEMSIDVHGGQQQAASRRKLKKARPQTSQAICTSPGLLGTPPTLHRSPSWSFRRSENQQPSSSSPSTAGPSPISTPMRGLDPAFTFPASSMNASPGDDASLSTGTPSSSGRQNTKKLGITASLRRRVSKRRQEVAASESSADEAEFSQSKRRGSVTHGVRRQKEREEGEKMIMSPYENGRVQDRNTRRLHEVQGLEEMAAAASDSGAETIQRVKTSAFSDSEDAKTEGPTTRNNILSGLSKRISRDFRASKIPFPSPERKRSIIFTRSTTVVPAELAEDAGRAEVIIGEEEPAHSASASVVTTATSKHRRPLSLSLILSRSVGRPRSSTASSNSFAPGSIAEEAVLARSIPSGPLSATVSGTFRRPSGYLHRSTASSGSVPTTNTIISSPMGASGRLLQTRRQSVDDSRSPPPALSHRRSFNPLWRSSAATVQEERPPSSLSLLSETSTVRPLPTASSTSTIRAHHVLAQQVGPSPLGDMLTQKDRNGHLPSLSLTLASTPLKNVTPVFTEQSPGAVSRPHTADPYSASYKIARNHFFIASNSDDGFRSPFDSSQSASTVTEGSRTSSSLRSQGSDGSLNGIMRRVSLSDLKIPQRISNAQKKIGQDLERVKQFKEGVEELKRLRRVYRSLVAAERTPDTSQESSPAPEDTSSPQQPEHPAGPSSLPTGTSERVDDLMSRVALDYHKWWEIADVLINLADGAEEDNEEQEELRASVNGRQRCRSEIAHGSKTPPKILRELQSPDKDGSPISPARTKNEDDTAATKSEVIVDQVKTQSTKAIEDHSIPVSAISPPQLVSPVMRSSPHLSRSYSTSSLSSPSSLIRQARSSQVPIATTISHFRQGEEGKSIEMNRNSTSLSERQLEILRGMLSPNTTISSSSSSISPSPMIRSVSAFASTSPIYSPPSPGTSFSPNTRPFGLNLAPLSPLGGQGRPHTAISTMSTSSSLSSLRRRASVKNKSGCIAISVPDNAEDEDEVSQYLTSSRRSRHTPSPLPESPPFHVSNMLPTPEGFIPPRPGGHTRRVSLLPLRSPSSRSTSTTTQRRSPVALGSGQGEDRQQTNESGGDSSLPGTPLMRKGRLRQASRAGMLGIRDFLKTFNNRRGAQAEDTSVSSVSLEAESEETSLNVTEEEEASKRGHQSTEEILESTPTKVERPPTKLEETQRLTTSQISHDSPFSGKSDIDSSTRGSPHSSDEEEEDWDRHSSDGEGEHQVSNSHLPRSDTQMTIKPTRRERCSTAGATTHTPGSSSSPRPGGGSGLCTPVRPCHGGTPTSLLRARTYSTNPNSNATVGQAVINTGQDVGAEHHLQQNAAGTKLVMTSEAMPTLLAKILEVKQHCATCVTELRNVTV